jgi:hypothetical protein
MSPLTLSRHPREGGDLSKIAIALQLLAWTDARLRGHDVWWEGRPSPNNQ